MPERRHHYFFDTVTLSNFALAGRVDLVTSRYGAHALVTSEVLDEVVEGIVAGHGALRDIEAAISAADLGLAGPPTSEERQTYRELLRVLAPGEASCIACARHRDGIVVTDDRAARECCAERAVRFTGTVGILKACCADGVLSTADADEILSATITAGYHSPVRQISDLL
jgi:predicted nucleic acid-binding protein